MEKYKQIKFKFLISYLYELSSKNHLNTKKFEIESLTKKLNSCNFIKTNYFPIISYLYINSNSKIYTFLNYNICNFLVNFDEKRFYDKVFNDCKYLDNLSFNKIMTVLKDLKKYNYLLENNYFSLLLMYKTWGNLDGIKIFLHIFKNLKEEGMVEMYKKRKANIFILNELDTLYSLIEHECIDCRIKEGLIEFFN